MFLRSGGSRGGAQGARPPPLFLDQNETQRAEKNFFGGCPIPPPPPPYLKVWIRHCYVSAAS